MYGYSCATIHGIVGKDVVLRRSESGNAYAYVEVRMPQMSTTDDAGNKVPVKDKWITLLATGMAAEAIARYGKGSVITAFDVMFDRKAPSERVEDGVKHVYHDYTFRLGSRYRIIPASDFVVREKKDAAGNATSSEAAASVSPKVTTNASDDDDYSDLASEINGSETADEGRDEALPF